MIGILIGIHVFLVILLIAVILFQQPRGRGLGAFFGGAQDLLGVRGAPTFFHKLTWGLGAAIGILAIFIAIFSKTGSIENREIIQRQKVYQLVPLFSEGAQEEKIPPSIPFGEDTGKIEK